MSERSQIQKRRCYVTTHWVHRCPEWILSDGKHGRGYLEKSAAKRWNICCRCLLPDPVASFTGVSSLRKFIKMYIYNSVDLSMPMLPFSTSLWKALKGMFGRLQIWSTWCSSAWVLDTKDLSSYPMLLSLGQDAPGYLMSSGKLTLPRQK